MTRRLPFSGFRRPAPSARKTRGTTAVEMALVAPVFFLMLIGLTEISMVMLVQHLMENAAYNATRLAKTGYAANGKTQLQTVTGVLDSELSSLKGVIDPNKITMTSTAYSDFNNIGQAGQGASGMGGCGQIVVYTISYPWKIFTPMMSAIIGTNGTLTISSNIVVRNEPY